MTSEKLPAVAVLGLGTMGHGIAQTFAAAGYTVRCFDEHLETRCSLHARIQKNLDAFVQEGLLPQAWVESILSRVIACESDAAAVSSVAFVTEAVKEDLAVKQELFARLETVVPTDTLLASNSSSFPISQSGCRLRHPERAIVTHWFNLPHLVPLVEVVPSPLTSEATVQMTMAILQRIGKQPLRLRTELPGFLVNRIQIAVMREVWDLLERGVASAAEIDAALSGSVGFRMAAVGPLEIHDFGGLDLANTVFQILAPEIRSSIEVPAVVRQLVEQGHLGAKTGRGFHEYPPEQLAERQERRDALFLKLIKLLHPDSVKGAS